MQTQQQPSFFERSLNKVRESATVRLFVIGILILVLLIPSGMIESLIYEREQNHNNAVNEISDKWGREQTITGPVLAVPYMETARDEKGQVYSYRTYSYYLPDDLKVTGSMQSQKRHRGIYEAVLYEGDLRISGSFKNGFSNITPALPANALLSEARLMVGISDVRGIRNRMSMQWDSTQLQAVPGVVDECLSSGVSFPLQGIDVLKGGEFAFDVKLAGSQMLYFTPVGKDNQIQLQSNWAGPKFDGAFLPTQHHIDDKGFKAEWRVLELNRNFVQHWNGANTQLRSSDFGVNMWIANDEYQKAHRSVHYCILFISLSFIFYFIIELKSGINVHPVQYLLIGLAVSIFYLLLLSLSEWLGFNLSYFISAAAVTSLIALFSVSVLRNRLYSLIAGIVQVLLYVFLFTTLQLEDLSLLIGTIGLFITLAILMFFARQLNEKKVEEKVMY